jgi:hypothetical protein
VRTHSLGERSRDLLARRGTAGVEDARDGVATLPPRLFLEVHPELHEVDDARGRLFRQDAHGAPPGQASAGVQRVVRVERRGVAGAGSGGDTALRQIAGRGEQRPLRDHVHVRIRGRAEGAVQAGDSGADDDEICGGTVHCEGLRLVV